VAFGGPSSLAVEGITNGNYGSKSCTHTDNQLNAWWAVDLQATYVIDKVCALSSEQLPALGRVNGTSWQVVVYNRVDCCAERLNNSVRRLCCRRSCAPKHAHLRLLCRL
jgi:hypothetical protein